MSVQGQYEQTYWQGQETDQILGDLYSADPVYGRANHGGGRKAYNPADYNTVGCNTGLGACGYQPCFNWNQFFISGWLQQGITLVPDSPESNNNLPMRFTDRANEYQMHQLYLTFGRMAAKSGYNWDWGFRADVLYGTDYNMVSSIGLETCRENLYGIRVNDPMEAKFKWNDNDGTRRGGTAAMYGLAMPQLYAEIYAPIQYGTNVKIGHFYSPMGNESVIPQNNFFYSHSYTMMYGGARTFTGMLADQKIMPNFSLIFGLTQGWDAWESPTNELSYMGGVSWNSWDNRSNLSFIVHTGETLNDNGKNNRTNYSLAFTHLLTPSLRYMLQHDLGVEDNAGSEITFDSSYNPSLNTLKGRWYSINQSLIWQWSHNFSVGARFEWFHDNNNTRIMRVINDGVNADFEGGNYYQMTLGANWKPNIGGGNLLIRPEIRWDWTDVKNGLRDKGQSGYSVYNDGTKDNSINIGIDMVIVL